MTCLTLRQCVLADEVLNMPLVHRSALMNPALRQEMKQTLKDMGSKELDKNKNYVELNNGSHDNDGIRGDGDPGEDNKDYVDISGDFGVPVNTSQSYTNGAFQDDSNQELRQSVSSDKIQELASGQRFRCVSEPNYMNTSNFTSGVPPQHGVQKTISERYENVNTGTSQIKGRNGIVGDKAEAHAMNWKKDSKPGHVVASVQHTPDNTVKPDGVYKDAQTREKGECSDADNPQSDYVNVDKWGNQGIQPKKKVPEHEKPDGAREDAQTKRKGKCSDAENPRSEYVNVDKWGNQGIQPNIEVPEHEKERVPPSTQSKPRIVPNNRVSNPAKTKESYENMSIERKSLEAHEMIAKQRRSGENMAKVHSFKPRKPRIEPKNIAEDQNNTKHSKNESSGQNELTARLKLMRPHLRMDEDNIYGTGIMEEGEFKSFEDNDDKDVDNGIQPPAKDDDETKTELKTENPCEFACHKDITNLVSVKTRHPTLVQDTGNEKEPPKFTCTKPDQNQSGHSYVNTTKIQSIKPQKFTCGKTENETSTLSYVNIPSSGITSGNAVNEHSNTAYVNTPNLEPVVPVSSTGKTEIAKEERDSRDYGGESSEEYSDSSADSDVIYDDGNVLCEAIRIQAASKLQNDGGKLPLKVKKKPAVTKELVALTTPTKMQEINVQHNDDGEEPIYDDTEIVSEGIKDPQEKPPSLPPRQRARVKTEQSNVIESLDCQEEEEELYYGDPDEQRLSIGPVLPDRLRAEHSKLTSAKNTIDNHGKLKINNIKDDLYEEVEISKDIQKPVARETTSNSAESKSLSLSVKQKPPKQNNFQIFIHTPSIVKSESNISKATGVKSGREKKPPQPLPKTNGSTSPTEISKSTPNLSKILPSRGNTVQRIKMDIVGSELERRLAEIKKKKLKPVA